MGSGQGRETERYFEHCVEVEGVGLVSLVGGDGNDSSFFSFFGGFALFL